MTACMIFQAVEVLLLLGNNIPVQSAEYEFV